MHHEMYERQSFSTVSRPPASSKRDTCNEITPGRYRPAARWWRAGWWGSATRRSISERHPSEWNAPAAVLHFVFRRRAAFPPFPISREIFSRRPPLPPSVPPCNASSSFQSIYRSCRLQVCTCVRVFATRPFLTFRGWRLLRRRKSNIRVTRNLFKIFQRRSIYRWRNLGENEDESLENRR